MPLLTVFGDAARSDHCRLRPTPVEPARHISKTGHPPRVLAAYSRTHGWLAERIAYGDTAAAMPVDRLHAPLAGWLHVAESDSAVATCNDEAILVGGEYLARSPGHVKNAPCSEKLEIGPAVGRPGAWLGVVGTYHVGNLMLAQRPIDARSTTIHLGRVGRQ